MKVIQLSTYDLTGGAALGSYRLHRALLEYGIDSTLFVQSKISDDWTVKTANINYLQKLYTIARRVVGKTLVGRLKTGNPIIHSPAFLPSGIVSHLNRSDGDLFHLHWINDEMLSVANIAKLNKPIVWTLRDMWAFCGAEHYTEDFRWRDGYNRSNRPNYEFGFDLNKWTWQRKMKNWHKPIYIVTLSEWLADCVRQSALMKDWPIKIIPNAIDTDSWKPVNKLFARKIFDLPEDVPLLLFGAIGGKLDSRKGWDLFYNALQYLYGEMPDMELVIFGQSKPKEPLNLQFPIHYMGHLHDNVSLKVLYSAADIVVVPSKMESFGKIAAEAHACGVPVVAFNATGLKDVVVHKKTGYLAKPFDAEDLAQGIQWVLEDSLRWQNLSNAARQRAVEQWSYEVVVSQYKALYSKIINKEVVFDENRAAR